MWLQVQLPAGAAPGQQAFSGHESFPPKLNSFTGLWSQEPAVWCRCSAESCPAKISVIEPYRRSYELLNRHNPHQRFSQLNNCSDDVNVAAISGNVCWIRIPLFINEGIIVFTLKRLLELGSRQAALKFDAMLLQQMKKQWAHRCDGTWVTGRALEKTLKKPGFSTVTAVWLEFRVWLRQNHPRLWTGESGQHSCKSTWPQDLVFN